MIQTTILFTILVALIITRKPRLFFLASLVCVILSIPLYSFWIFYTAQKLVEFAFYFLAFGVVFSFINNENKT